MNVVLNRRFQVSQPHSSFPDRTELTLDYFTTTRWAPGVITYGDVTFHLNSLYDPEYTGTGHQPRDFDTWASVYHKYRVLETLVELDVRQRASHGIYVCAIPSNSSTALTASDFPQELPRAVRLGMTSPNQPVARMVQKFDLRALLGMTREEFRGDDETGASVTANPAQSVYLHVFANQIDGATAADFELAIRMRFRCEFYDRKVSAPSALVAAVAARIAQLQQVVETASEDARSAASASARSSEPPSRPASLAEALAGAFLGTAPRK